MTTGNDADRPTGDAAPRLGAYVKRPRAGNGPLDDVLFDPGTRGDAQPPRWQAALCNRIVEEIRLVLSSDLDLAVQRIYLSWLSAMFTAACVALPATPRVPALAADYERAIDKLMESFRLELDTKVAALLDRHLRYAVAGLLLTAPPGVALVLHPDLAAYRELGNCMLVASAAFVGLLFSDYLIKRVGAFVEYLDLRRQLDRPLARVFATAGFAVAVALALSTGALSIKAGSWSTADLRTATPTALLVGFLAGIPGSFLSRRVAAWITGGAADGQRTGATAQRGSGRSRPG